MASHITLKLPETREDLRTLARGVFVSLINKYQAEGQQFKDDTIQATGLIHRCAGSVSLLLLANAFQDFAKEASWRDIVIQEFEEVVKHVSESGFDASPWLSSKLASDMFSPKASTRYFYTDSVSWALSLALLLRLSQRNQLIALTAEQKNAVIEMARTCLDVLCGSVCEQGGWGFANGCTAPDLYFSYAVSEALADFGDYVLGESGPEISEPDHDLQRALSPELVSRVQEARKRTSGWLIDRFLPGLGTELINPYRQDPSDHILLYYTYFVIDMLTVSTADAFFPERAHEIRQKIEHAIYLTRIEFDRAREDADWWGNAEKSSLRLKWENHPELSKLVPRLKMTIDEPGLAPLCLRCNGLYAYYYTRGLDKKMADLFQLVYEDRDQKTGLWDTLSFSLMVTERAVEAIVDYSDYLEEFQKEAAPSKMASMFRDAVAEAVREYFAADGSGSLISGPGSDTPEAVQADAGTAMKEDEMARLFTSVLSKGGKVLGDNIDPRLSKETFGRLRGKFHDFLLELMADKMLEFAGGKPTPKEREDLLSGLKTREKELFVTLATWVIGNPTLGLGEVFTTAAGKAAEQQALGGGTEQVKTKRSQT